MGRSAPPIETARGRAAALAPIAIGLILASGYTLALGADRSPGAFALTLVATAALALTRVNPVWILLAAGVASGRSRGTPYLLPRIEHRAAAARRTATARVVREQPRRAPAGYVQLVVVRELLAGVDRPFASMNTRPSSSSYGWQVGW